MDKKTAKFTTHIDSHLSSKTRTHCVSLNLNIRSQTVCNRTMNGLTTPLRRWCWLDSSHGCGSSQWQLHAGDQACDTLNMCFESVLGLQWVCGRRGKRQCTVACSSQSNHLVLSEPVVIVALCVCLCPFSIKPVRYWWTHLKAIQ